MEIRAMPIETQPALPKTAAYPVQEPQRQKSGIKAWQIVLCCVSVVLVLFVIVYFCIPFGHGETLLSKTMYAISDTDTRFDSAMSKGDRPMTGETTQKLYIFMRSGHWQKNQDLWKHGSPCCVLTQQICPFRQIQHGII